MKQYNAIIIDDEWNVREALGIMLKEYCPEICLCGSAGSASKGRDLLQKFKVDFIFLDISMPDEDGFDFISSIRDEHYGIIFVTAFEEYALKAIKANAIDYLLKPVDPQELQVAVLKAIQYHELRKNKTEVRIIYSQSLDNLHKQVQSEQLKIEKLTVADQFGYRVVKISDIMYLESDSHYTILHLSSLDKVVAIRPLGEIEKMLTGHPFFRINTSIMLNLDYLRGYSIHEGGYAELTDGTRLSIPRIKTREFQDKLRHFIKR